MKEINSAILYFENKPVVKLDLPELRIENGLIYIDCYINKDFFGEDRKKSIINKKSVLDNKIFLNYMNKTITPDEISFGKYDVHNIPYNRSQSGFEYTFHTKVGDIKSTGVVNGMDSEIIHNLVFGNYLSDTVLDQKSATMMLGRNSGANDVIRFYFSSKSDANIVEKVS